MVQGSVIILAGPSLESETLKIIFELFSHGGSSGHT